MNFNRFYLLEIINQIKKENNNEVYDDLIRVLYRLFEQEKICNKFIVDFFYYEQLENQTIERYMTYKRNSDF